MKHFKQLISRRNLMAGLASLPALGSAFFTRSAVALSPSDATWEVIKGDIFEKPEFLDGTSLLTLEAPSRAYDPAVVPLKITANPDYNIAKLTLVIDENPIPLAAEVEFGPASASASIETRVRVNAYSYIRVIATLDDGTHYMIKRYVKATGGCGAPSGKDPAAAAANMGKMRLRRFALHDPTDQAAVIREAQVMIRHPNHTGFQMDQVSLLFVPPHFVETIEIKQDDVMILKIVGGISLSEDPNIRFSYLEKKGETIAVKAVDTDYLVFEKSFPSADA